MVKEDQIFHYRQLLCKRGKNWVHFICSWFTILQAEIWIQLRELYWVYLERFWWWRAAGALSVRRLQGLPPCQHTANSSQLQQSWAHQQCWWYLCDNIFKKGQKPLSKKHGKETAL